MNGHKAKALRRAIYGDMAQRDRKYTATNIRAIHMVVEGKTKESFMARGIKIVKMAVKNAVKDVAIFHSATLVADGRRRRYQAIKRKYLLTPWRLRRDFLKRFYQSQKRVDAKEVYGI